MLRRKGQGAESSGFGGFLAEGTEIDGEVRFSDELRADGRITGRIFSEKGRLMVGDTGHIEADIDVGVASISGTVSGTLNASVKVEIHSTGRFYGNIHAPALIIEEGAVFEGNCAMSGTEGPAHRAEREPGAETKVQESAKAS